MYIWPFVCWFFYSILIFSFHHTQSSMVPSNRGSDINKLPNKHQNLNETGCDIGLKERNETERHRPLTMTQNMDWIMQNCFRLNDSDIKILAVRPGIFIIINIPFYCKRDNIFSCSVLFFECVRSCYFEVSSLKIWGSECVLCTHKPEKEDDFLSSHVFLAIPILILRGNSSPPSRPWY